MKLKPQPRRVILRRPRVETHSPGGIALPNAGAEDKGGTAVVVAAGDGCSVTAGQTVLVGKYGGQTVRVEGAELLVLNDDDILCVVED
jgi:chaperonin GroES